MSKLERIVHDDSNGLDYILVGEIYEKIVDIRKVYKNGVTDSVIDSYRSYLKQ